MLLCTRVLGTLSWHSWHAHGMCERAGYGSGLCPNPLPAASPVTCSGLIFILQLEVAVILKHGTDDARFKPSLGTSCAGLYGCCRHREQLRPIFEFLSGCSRRHDSGFDDSFRTTSIGFASPSRGPPSNVMVTLTSAPTLSTLPPRQCL